MAWILLLLAVACFLVPFFTVSFALGALCLLAALVLIVVALLLLLSARVGGATRNAPILSAEELRALREQAQAGQRDATDAPHADARSVAPADDAPPSAPV